MTAVVITNPNRLGYIKQTRKRIQPPLNRRRIPRLWALAGQVPTLDLDFTQRTIVDRVSGTLTPTFTRPSSTKLLWNGTQFVSYPADVPGFELRNGVWEYSHEPAATNSNPRSHQPITGGWTTANNTYAENTGACVVTGATRWTSTGAAGTLDKRVRFNCPVSPAGTWCVSWFIYANTQANILLTLQDNLGVGIRTGVFNVNTGQFGGAPTTTGTASTPLQGVIQYGAGVYRVWVSGTIPAGGAFIQCILHHDAFGATSSVATIEGGHTQLETGPIPTSPVVTVGTTVNRTADTMTISDAPFASFYNQLGGCFYSEVILPSIPSSAPNRSSFSTHDGTSNNRYSQRAYISGTTNNSGVFIRSGAAVIADMQEPGRLAAGQLLKMAARISTDNFGVSLNGAAPIVDTSGTLGGTMTTFAVGNIEGPGEWLNGNIRRIIYWPPGPAQSRIQQLTA